MGRSAREPDEPVIEFLPVDERAFGATAVDDTTFTGFDGDDDPFDDEAPRPRWLIGVSAVVVVAFVAVGVIAAAPWDDDTVATPATTVPTTVSPTTTTAPTETDAPAVGTNDPGIVLDPVPDGLSLRESQVGPGAAQLAFGWSEVWAEPGATRTSGRWFSVTLEPFVSMADVGGDTSGDTAVDVGGRDGRIAVADDGVATLRFGAGQSDAGQLVLVSAFGFTTDELAALGASIGVDDDRPQLVDDRPTFLRPELIVGFERLAAAPAAQELTDELIQPHDRTAGTIYAGAIVADQQVVVLQLSPPSAEIDVLAPLTLETQVATEPPAGFVGTGLVVGRRNVDGVPASVAWWDVDGQRVTVLTTLGVDELVALLPTVRIVGDDVGWVLEPGTEGFIAVAASDPDPFRAEAQPAGTFELWSTPGAARHQGAWAAIQSLPWRVGGSMRGRRIAIGDRTGIVDEGDVTTLTWSPDEASTITVTSFGLTVDQMIEVATRVARGAAPLETVFDGMSPVLDRATLNDRLDEELFVRSRSSSTFTRPDDHGTVVVESASLDLAEEQLLRFVLDGDRGTLEVYGSRTSVITFLRDGTRVIVRSDRPLDELDALMPSVRPSTGPEWDDLVTGPPNYVNGPATRDARPQPVALGVTQAGTAWRVTVDVGRDTVTLDDAGTAESFPITDLLGGSAVTLRSSASTTFVVVRSPANSGATVARVAAGASSRVIALSPVDGDDDHLYGALAFSEDGDVTVQLLDQQGRVVDGAA